MNTKDNWLTTATIHDALRRELWISVFPGAVVPIISIIPVKVNVPFHTNVDAYMLDLDALTDDRIWGVCQVISTVFNLPIEEVKVDIFRGVPILAEGVHVLSRDQGLVLSMMDDEVSSPYWDHDEDLNGHQEWEED